MYKTIKTDELDHFGFPLNSCIATLTPKPLKRNETVSRIDR